MSVDIDGGAGAGWDTKTAAAAADAGFLLISAGASGNAPFDVFADTAAGNLATVVLPTGLTSDFTATFKGELAAGFLTTLPEDKGLPATTFFAALTVVDAAVRAGDTDTGFFAAIFLAGPTTEGKFVSRDFTMCFLWIANRSYAVGCLLRELSPDSSAALTTGHPTRWSKRYLLKPIRSGVGARL